MGFLSKLKGKAPAAFNYNAPPPEWAPAPEQSHDYGLLNEAPEEEFRAGEDFCSRYPPDAPRLLPSQAIETLQDLGSCAWAIEHTASPRFRGTITGGGGVKSNEPITIHTQTNCKSVCLLSNLPLMAGLYDIQGKRGVYYEVLIKKMDGIVAVGTALRPYPEFRAPGWNRGSAALHLDDLRKFFEDPNGGRDYDTDGILRSISPDDTIGCGYDFSSTSIFFTYNGIRLPPAFSGVYHPRHSFDVFAAVGVEGHNEIQVNFGADLFNWKEGNDWAWRAEGHVGKMVGSSSGFDEELPVYGDASGTTRVL